IASPEAIPILLEVAENSQWHSIIARRSTPWFISNIPPSANKSSPCIPHSPTFKTTPPPPTTPSPAAKLGQEKLSKPAPLSDSSLEKTIVPKSRIKDERALATSIMPEELLNGLGEKELRDLFAYLSASHKP